MDRQLKFYQKLWVRVVAIVLVIAMVVTGIFAQYGSNFSLLSAASQQTAIDATKKTDSLASLASLYVEAGKYQLAEKCYTKLIDAGNATTTIYSNRARCRLLLENYKGTIYDCEQYFAIGGIDTDGTIYAMQGTGLMNVENYTTAVEAFYQAILNGYKAPAEIYAQTMLCNYVLGDYEAVIGDCNKYLAIENKDTAKAYQWLGFAQMELSQFDNAKTSFSTCISVEDTIKDIHYYKGVCNTTLQNYEEALQDYTESINRGESLQLSYYNRGLCYLSLGKYEDARNDFQITTTLTDDVSIVTTAQDLLTQLDTALATN